MEDEVIALSPLLVKTSYPRNPIARAPLHFHYVRDSVSGPKIRSITFHRLTSELLCESVIAGLLQTVGITAQDQAVAWNTFAPRRKHARHRIANRRTLAQI